MAKTRKDKGVSKPRKPEDVTIYNARDFGALTPEEQARLVTNLANKLNRRMARLEKADLDTVPAYEGMKKSIKKLTGKEGTRYKKPVTPRKGEVVKPEYTKEEAKAAKEKYSKRLWKLYQEMSYVAGYQTATIKGATSYIESVGRTSTGENYFDIADYKGASKEDQRRFWKNFEKYRQYLQDHDKYNAGSGGLSSLSFYNEYKMLKNKKIGSGFSKTTFQQILDLQETVLEGNLEEAFPDESELDVLEF